MYLLLFDNRASRERDHRGGGSVAPPPASREHFDGGRDNNYRDHRDHRDRDSFPAAQSPPPLPGLPGWLMH
jgi:hypothetical protein